MHYYSVVHGGFLDVIIDFVIMDAFEGSFATYPIEY